MPLFAAFNQSINMPAVAVGLDVGIENVVNTLNKLGVEQSINQYPSLLLGAQPLSAIVTLRDRTSIAQM